MFRNYAVAALRHLARNRLYNGMMIAGLAVGFAAAILSALYVHDEYSYDAFVPGASHVYRVSETHSVPGERDVISHVTSASLAGALKSSFPQIQYAARLDASGSPPQVRRGLQASKELNLVWADPDFFRIMPLPTVAGDLASALDAPDGVVVTQSVARKYFGADAPVGQSLLINQRPMRVTAVIKDLPSNTHLAANIYAASLSPGSDTKRQEQVDTPLNETVATYVKLRPDARPQAMAAGFAPFIAAHFPTSVIGGPGARMRLDLIPLREIHLSPSTQGAFKQPGDKTVDAAIACVGLLIVVVAAINFVTLMTARASRRAIEVGMRKVVGATHRQLIVQFMGEALLYVLLAGVGGVALAEISLPAFNALLHRQIAFNYLTDPLIAGGLLLTVALTAGLAGAYPALVLSAFRPAAVLRGGPITLDRGGAGRQALVIAQFVVLTCLTLFAITLTRQTLFGLNEGMRLDKDNVLLLSAEPCTDKLRDAMRQVQGVTDAACASAQVLGLGDNPTSATANGRQTAILMAPVDFDFFKVYRLKPLAGRLFDQTRPADGFVEGSAANPPVIINETAMRKLGFASPAAAIGQTVQWVFHTDLSKAYGGDPQKPSEIVGVVPDFTFGSMKNVIQPTLYMVGPKIAYYSMALNLRVDPAMAKTASPAIDAVWRRMGDGTAVQKASVTLFTLRLYLDAIGQGETVIVAALIAISVACLGLFALSAYTTERRTREIGIRKALGASASDIVRLLLWQFTKPVLWANLLAAPLAYWLLNAWLGGFAYHVGVAPWIFAVAAAITLTIAWTTVLFHALRVSRARPVNALRYE